MSYNPSGGFYPETLNAKQCSVVCDPQGRVWLFVGLAGGPVKCFVFTNIYDFIGVQPGATSYVIPGPSFGGSTGAAPWSVAINDGGTIMLAYADDVTKKIFERHVDATLSAWTAASQVNAIGATGTNARVGSVAVEGGPGRTFHVMFQMATNQHNDPPLPSADPIVFYQRTTDNGASWMSRESLVDGGDIIYRDVRGYFSFAAKDTGEVFYCSAGQPAGRNTGYYSPNPQPTLVNMWTDWMYAEGGTGPNATYVEAFVDRDGNFGELMVRVPSDQNGNMSSTYESAWVAVRRVAPPSPGFTYSYTPVTETVLQMLPTTLYSAYGVHNLMPLVLVDGRRRTGTDMPGFLVVTKDLDHIADARNNPMQRRTFTRRLVNDPWSGPGTVDLVLGCSISPSLTPGVGVWVIPFLNGRSYAGSKLAAMALLMSLGGIGPDGNTLGPYLTFRESDSGAE